MIKKVYGGDLELSIISSMLNIIIIILIDGYNAFNVYEPENINNLNKNYIFLNFVENKHFEYLQLNENNPLYTSKEEYFEYINKLCNKI